MFLIILECSKRYCYFIITVELKLTLERTIYFLLLSICGPLNEAWRGVL